MKTCLVHTCYNPQLGELYFKKMCRCRKLITYEPDSDHPEEPCARRMLDLGFAAPHLPEKIDTGRVAEHICTFCVGDKLMKRSCNNCVQAYDEKLKRLCGTGVVKTPVYKFEYSGNIVLVTEASVNAKGELEFRPSSQKKTTRIDGITRADIERAYIYKKEADILKINEWGESAKAVIAELMVPFREDPFEGRCLFYSPEGK